MTTPRPVLGSVGLLYAVVLVGADVPPLRSEACKKLKMAILVQGLRKTGEKGDFALYCVFPVENCFL